MVKIFWNLKQKSNHSMVKLPHAITPLLNEVMETYLEFNQVYVRKKYTLVYSLNIHIFLFLKNFHQCSPKQ